MRVKEVIPVLRVPDIQATLEFYTGTLGAADSWSLGEPPAYGGVSLSGHQIHFAADEASTERGELYVYVESGIEPFYERCRTQGANVVVPLDRRPYGMRDFAVLDPNGIKLVFGEDCTAE